MGLVQTPLRDQDRLTNQPRDEPNKGGRIDGLTLSKHQRDQGCLLNSTITDVQCNDGFLLEQGLIFCTSSLHIILKCIPADTGSHSEGAVSAEILIHTAFNAVLERYPARREDVPGTTREHFGGLGVPLCLCAFVQLLTARPT